MRTTVFLIFLFTGLCLFGQKENIPTTENFSIEGKVKKGMVVSLEDLSSSYTSYSIDSIVITNHLGENRSTLKKNKRGLIKRCFR